LESAKVQINWSQNTQPDGGDVVITHLFFERHMCPCASFYQLGVAGIRQTPLALADPLQAAEAPDEMRLSII
jgi:hypothetical protein